MFDNGIAIKVDGDFPAGPTGGPENRPGSAEIHRVPPANSANPAKILQNAGNEIPRRLGGADVGVKIQESAAIGRIRRESAGSH